MYIYIYIFIYMFMLMYLAKSQNPEDMLCHKPFELPWMSIPPYSGRSL